MSHFRDSNTSTKSKFSLVGHRGANREAPENSLSAFRKALESPIFGIEFDVQLTKDEIPIIYHDRTLKKITGLRKRVGDYTYKELQGYDWGRYFSDQFRGEPCLSLETLLQELSGKTKLFLEIKSRKKDRKSGRSQLLVQRIFDQLDEQFSQPQLEELKILSFDLELLRFATGISVAPKYFWNIDLPENALAQTKENLDFLSGFGAPIKTLSPELVEMAHANKQEVLTYACNLPYQAQRAIEFKADYFLTDKPAWLYRYLQ